MSADTESYDFDPGQTVVLNALIDVYAEDTIALDEESRRHLEEVVEANTTADEQSVVVDEFDRLSNLEEGESADITPEIHDFVETVTRGLAEAGYSVSVSHEYQQQFTTFDARVYSFLNTRDAQHLESLELTPAVEDALVAGVDLLETGDTERACSKFSEAIDRSPSHDDRVASRIVAAWGNFQAGDDETALEHIEKAYQLEDTSWAVQIVAASVKRNESENDLIRARKKSVGLVLRWVTAGSENTTARAEIGTPDDDGVTWEGIAHKQGHAFLNRVYPDTRIRFELQGKSTEFPGLQVYYLAVGLYDNEMDYVEKVIERFGSGPSNTDSVERISIFRHDD